jgi:lipopolysaccharide transport system permease protein
MLQSMKQELRYIFTQKSLIIQLTKREILGRYKGSYLGILWSFVTPMLMLIVYTFVFSVVFKARWGTDVETNRAEFALLLFAGLIIFNIFSEVVSKAPSIITSNGNFVKKVVFPLEVLPIVTLGASLFHAGISLIILIIFVLIFMGKFYITFLLLPLVLLPICLVSLGLGWFLSSLGVYLRDIHQIISVIIPALMFMSPIFYPISAIPEKLRILYYINPISYSVEDIRKIIIWGQLPNWGVLGMGLLFGIFISIFGYLWFKKTRGGFADVL